MAPRLHPFGPGGGQNRYHEWAPSADGLTYRIRAAATGWLSVGMSTRRTGTSRVIRWLCAITWCLAETLRAAYRLAIMDDADTRWWRFAQSPVGT